jgi:uncharacterized membrane protein YcaP (DUF421 family)
VRTAVFHGLDMLWKAALFFALLATLLRLMGKREIRSLSSLDLVVALMISESAILTIEDDKIPVLVGMVPVLALAGLQMLTAYLAMKSTWLRGLLTGRPSVLVAQGQVRDREIAGLRLNLNDLLGQLRSHGVPSIADVEYAILETDGVLSVIPKAEARPLTARDLGITPPREGLPLDVVVDGEVVASSLKQLGKDEAWVVDALEAHSLGPPRDVLLASVDAQGAWYVQPRGGAKPVTFTPSSARDAGGGASVNQRRVGAGQGGAGGGGTGQGGTISQGGTGQGGAADGQRRASRASQAAGAAVRAAARSAQKATAAQSAAQAAARSQTRRAEEAPRPRTRRTREGDPRNEPSPEDRRGDDHQGGDDGHGS